MNSSPRRIVCLSAEAADWFWRIGAWENVAGVTAFFNQPKNAPPKPRVSGFSSANLEQIEKLNPDLVITFSDVQTDLAAELIRRGFSVFATNQRTLAEIEDTLALLGRVVGCENEAEKLLREFHERLAPIKNSSKHPRVYFEEWNEPMISGICWVSELIERTGGEDVFSELKTKRAAMERVVTSEQICAANPEIILASWCGKPVNVAEIKSRADWQSVSAVRSNCIFEIPPDDILQPGFRLVYGFEQMKQIIGAT
ncbi:MAG TPA: helical backbone metal receptor [Verrucomicrobiae bacterium]|nr:helical backbone metal receptor [Verrucomicrobiae bacterium]